MVHVTAQERYSARVAMSEEDIASAQRLRHSVFIQRGAGRGGDGDRDIDRFDPICTHMLIEDQRTGGVVATFRILQMASGLEVGKSYSAQFYGLNGLSRFPFPMAELGRFCVAGDTQDPEVLRVAWGALAGYVDHEGIALLFGCSSFSGTDERAYDDAFAMLRDQHLAPREFQPEIKSAKVFQYAERLRRAPDRARALRTMPPLLRSYLAMGGWVSDHAVVDEDMNTLHVFTGLEIARIPPARARVLRATAG